jgi:hypothetical protein
MLFQISRLREAGIRGRAPVLHDYVQCMRQYPGFNALEAGKSHVARGEDASQARSGYATDRCSTDSCVLLPISEEAPATNPRV